MLTRTTTRGLRHRTRTARLARLAALLVAVAALVTGLGIAPATAAGGPAVVTTSVQILDGAQQPITTLQADPNDANTLQFSLNISYSCGPQAACTGVTIQVAPQQLDTFYGTQRFAAYQSSTLPTGATLTANSATAGQTFSLGTVAANTSGSFTVVYNSGFRGFGVAPQSFFLDGTTIDESVTIDATNSVAASTGSASVVWHITTPDPGVLIDAPATARADTDVTYTVYMTSNCLEPHSNGNRGLPSALCAHDYTVTDTLPAGAVFVSASNGGTYDAATHTVTWSDSGPTASIGWGSLNVFGPPRTITVQYPASLVTDPDQCVITETDQLAVQMTYLDGAQKSASTQQAHQINACTPFAAATLLSKTSTTEAPGTVWQDVPNYWYVNLENRSNVPGVATVVDDQLDQANLPVTAIALSSSGTITATLDDGTVTTVSGFGYNAPAGRRITAATVVSDPLVGPNNVVTDQSKATGFQVRYTYVPTAPLPAGGVTRTNTASASMSFPSEPSLATLDLGSKSATVRALMAAQLVPRITGVSIAGGGNPVPGTPVTFTVDGVTSKMDPAVSLEPQYVFAAPPGWSIVPGSAAIPALADAIFDYRTVTIAGQQREIVVASRPAGTVWGVNDTWPPMTVVATPSTAAPGSSGVATFYIGDANDDYDSTNAIWNSTGGNYYYADAADLDGDGVLTDSFGWTQSAAITVGSASQLTVVKEICSPDPSAADGCAWQSDSSTPVSIAADATTVDYRVTITNSGNTPMSNVAGYDVLPYVGDTGTSQARSGVSRGSTFAERVGAVSSVSPGLTLQYSGSTNPCRAAVYPGGPAGCVDDWNSTAIGSRSIRATATTLAVGASLSFTYRAAVDGTPTAFALACNSFAAASATTPVSEVNPVCAQVAAAPGLSIVKSGTLHDLNGNGVVDAGESIDYAFVVTNTGNEPLHDVIVDDAKVTNVTPASVALAPGAQQVFTADPFTASQTDIDTGGTVSNTATATGLDTDDQPVVSDPDTVVTPLADPAPGLRIVKTAQLNDGNGNGLADAGETIAYAFTVTNTGNVTMTGVTVNDAKVTGIAPASTTLIPGQRAVFTSDPYPVTAHDVAAAAAISNTATATGTDPASDPLESDPSTVTTPTGPIPSDPAPSLAFTGLSLAGPLGLAALLLAGGTGLVLLRLRRRRS